ncbi:MAG: hypothetical protein K9J16_10065 [Melioribacteraceae bacterium]|nr:hypothetical protein [Melioribacteraceae bacterium]MCF8354280.1 hypothetical protein [Melioribacteraceae bacterium]MCF8394588.1 hypothetical protein [Melioribacteraceae bacterium]MCF8419743.1 hypothetical protein [Melioribacteraceae bacterium]
MKILLVTFVISILFISGCNQKLKFNEIKVGMTYNEVENIIGKPISQTRGANELRYDLDNIPYEILSRIRQDDLTTNLDTNRWIVPHEIKTIGNLIYISWHYDEFKTDTFYTVLDEYKTVADTTFNKYPVYFIDNIRVSKHDYDKSDGYEYRLHDNKLVDKSLYDAYKKAGYYKLPPPRRVSKTIEYRDDMKINYIEVKDSVENLYYEVEYQYCIIFDASSGRVTTSGYFPLYLKKL